MYKKIFREDFDSCPYNIPCPDGYYSSTGTVPGCQQCLQCPDFQQNQGCTKTSPGVCKPTRNMGETCLNDEDCTTYSYKNGVKYGGCLYGYHYCDLTTCAVDHNPEDEGSWVFGANGEKNAGPGTTVMYNVPVCGNGSIIQKYNYSYKNGNPKLLCGVGCKSGDKYDDSSCLSNWCCSSDGKCTNPGISNCNLDCDDSPPF